jgi:hypothetical protein
MKVVKHNKERVAAVNPEYPPAAGIALNIAIAKSSETCYILLAALSLPRNPNGRSS